MGKNTSLSLTKLMDTNYLENNYIKQLIKYIQRLI